MWHCLFILPPQTESVGSQLHPSLSRFVLLFTINILIFCLNSPFIVEAFKKRLSQRVWRNMAQVINIQCSFGGEVFFKSFSNYLSYNNQTFLCRTSVFVLLLISVHSVFFIFLFIHVSIFVLHSSGELIMTQISPSVNKEETADKRDAGWGLEDVSVMLTWAAALAPQKQETVAAQRKHQSTTCCWTLVNSVTSAGDPFPSN